MKLNCGMTYEEAKEFYKDYQWERWFAWYPVKVGFRDCRWLQFVERRVIKVGRDCDDEYYLVWDYRLP